MAQIIVHVAPRFEKHFRKLPTVVQQQVTEKDELFRTNPHHPQLRTHQLRGALEGFWSYSVNYHYRVLFRFVGQGEVLYYDIGTHEIYQ